jgi:hypothetical protein
MIAFSTTEVRLISWIQALYFRYIAGLKENTELDVRWEEHEDINDPSKCDKIWLNLSRTGNNPNDNLLTITIYLSTGRIQIQGKSLTEWGNKEFDIILRMIDSD